MFNWKGPIVHSTEGMLLVTRPLPKGLVYFDKPEISFSGTILDERLAKCGGCIQLPAGAFLYEPDAIKAIAPNLPPTLPPTWVKDKILGPDQKDIVFKVLPKSYVYLPKGINTAFELASGLKVLGTLQRAANRLIEAVASFRKASGNPWDDSGASLQAAWASYLGAIKDEVFYKGGMLDCMVASVLPFTARGVLANDCSLAPNQIKIPYLVARRWVRNERFREFYGLEEANPHLLTGLRVLVGRQPTHRYTNLWSAKIVVSHPKQTAFGMNPLVVNLFDGDFDGDTVHILMPMTSEGRADLMKMTVESIFPMSKPGKELKGTTLPSDISQATIISRGVIQNFQEGAALGLSCNWHDLVGDGKGTGYYADTDPDKMSEFAAWARGEHLSPFKDQVTAMMDYRLIKGGVARAGGLSNSIQAMCLAEVWDWPDVDDAAAKMRLVGDIKHILCQGPLDAKHGGVEEENFRVVSSMFYAPNMSPFKTKAEYRQFLVEVMHLPEEGVDFILDIYFGFADPPVNINQVLQEKNPQFVLTRRQASANQLERFAEMSTHPAAGLHSLFIYRDRTSVPEEETK